MYIHNNSDDLDKLHTIKLITIIVSFFSFFGSLFIITMYIRYPNLRNFAFKLVMFLSFSDLIFSFSKIMGIIDFNSMGKYCYIQAFLINSS